MTTVRYGDVKDFTELALNALLTELVNTAVAKYEFDFGAAPGDTLREKSESLFAKLQDIENDIHPLMLPGFGFDTIITSPELALILGCCKDYLVVENTPDKPVKHVGNLPKWEVFKCDALRLQDLIICKDNYLVSLKVKNV